MVTIIDYTLRTSNEGRSFFALILQGGIEIVKSANGSTYVTIRKCSLPTTFDELTCKSLVGQDLPGTIQKVECDPYEYTIEKTGEIIMLSHRFEYVNQEAQAVKGSAKVFEPSSNGVHHPNS